MPGVILMVLSLIVNYIGHKTGWWRTICQVFRHYVPRLIGAGLLITLFTWLFPHVIFGYKQAVEAIEEFLETESS